MRSPAPLAERGRYLATFGEHLAVAAALRALHPRPAARVSSDGRLRAAVLSPHPPSHLGTFVRFTRWVPHLARLGCDMEILTGTGDSLFEAYKRGDAGADTRYHDAALRNTWRNLQRAAEADVVVLHRGLLPFSPWQRPTFEQLLARLNPRLVYDFYDPIWIQREEACKQAASRLGRWLHPPGKIESLIRLARVVTVSNERLADFARRHHDDVHVVPMLLEPSDYEPRRHDEHHPVVLGWFGSRNNLPRLSALAAVLRRVAERRDVVLHVVAPEPVEIPGVRVKSFTHPWSPESERADLAAVDIGLLPLDEANANDREKSPFKLLQYLAAGLAVVATPMTMDTSVLRPGDSFLPARNEDEWVEAISRLVDDAGLRARLGAAARAAVEDNYSFGMRSEEFLDILSTAAGRTSIARTARGVEVG